MDRPSTSLLGRAWVALALSLFASGCGGVDAWPFDDATEDTVTPVTADSDGTGDQNALDVEACPMNELAVISIGGDGAGGHTLSLFGFSTDGEACELSEPVSAVVTDGGQEVPRGTFFPMRPFGQTLEPGERAVIGVETTSCDVDNGPHGAGVEVLFEDGHTRTLPLRSDGCNLRWDGFMAWG